MSSLSHVLRTTCAKPWAVSRLLPQASLAAVQTRGLRSKREILLERDRMSLKWAKPLIERAQKLAEPSTETVKEPHQLHVVYRNKKLSGRPWWEKETMTKLGLADVTLSTPVVLKNTPSVNKMLQDVKHLVRIQVLKFPHGLPEDSSDFEHSFVNTKGEFIVKRRLNAIESDIPSKREKWEMDGETLKKNLIRKLQTYDVHSEYFPTHYEWKRNEDGKEYRFNFNKNRRKYQY